MSKRNPTEDEYYATLDEDLQGGMALDHVADMNEWRLFKKALLRWIDDQDREWDQAAVNREHGGE